MSKGKQLPFSTAAIKRKRAFNSARCVLIAVAAALIASGLGLRHLAMSSPMSNPPPAKLAAPEGDALTFVSGRLTATVRRRYRNHNQNLKNNLQNFLSSYFAPLINMVAHTKVPPEAYNADWRWNTSTGFRSHSSSLLFFCLLFRVWTEISFMRLRSCKVSVSETQFRLPFPDRLSVCCCKLLFDKVFLSLFLRWFSSVYERCLYSHLFTEVSVCLTRVAVVPACLLHFNHKHPLMCPLIGSRRP